MLRINPDGTIPADNPFYDQTTGKNRAIWALGLRNPFTFAFQPGTGPHVHQRRRREHVGGDQRGRRAGANYGWPDTEGADDRPALPSPRSTLRTTHTDGGCAIAGGTFYNPPRPRSSRPQYDGEYFFADFGSGWIRDARPGDEGRRPRFATALTGTPVDLDVGAGREPVLPRAGRDERQRGGGVPDPYTGEPGAGRSGRSRRARTVSVGPAGDVQRVGDGGGDAGLPVAAQRGRTSRRDAVDATRSPRRRSPTAARSSA